MKFLINISSLDMTGEHRKDAETIYDRLDDFFNDQVPGDVSLPDLRYLPDLPPCIFGSEEPEAIILAADTWNDEIRRDVDRALTALLEKKEKNGGVWPIDTTEVYLLRAALQALDNHFDDFGQYATWCDLDDERYPGTALCPFQVEHIKSHPEEYAIIEIYPQ